MVIALVAIGGVVVVGGGVGAYVALSGSDDSPVKATKTVTTNDGTDARRPVLPAQEEGYVDPRDGWNWSNKCYINIQAGKWGWAKAECDRGVAMNPSSHETHAMLLYNEGLIAKAAGDKDGARRDFVQSLALRENKTVRAELSAL